MKSKVLVTGATGFIGSHLTEHLLRKGYAVTCLVRQPNRLGWLEGLDVEIAVGDCREPPTLAGAVKGASVVVHAAGLTRARRPKEYYRVNHVGTGNILEACARYNGGIERFILVSSQAAAGPSRNGTPVKAEDAPAPVSDYGRSKLLAEKETLGFTKTFPVTILRPSAVYGPRDRDMCELFRWASRGLTLEIAGGDRYLNFCYVLDLVQAVASVIERPTRSGGIYFVAESKPYSWSEFRDRLLTTGGVSARTLRIPYAAAYAIGLAAEVGSLFTSRPALTNRQKVREAVQRYWVCDTTAAEQEFGFRSSYPLERGIAETWQWYRSNNWLR